MVELYKHDSIQSTKVIALELTKDTLEHKIDLLEQKINALDTINKVNDELLTIEKERVEMTKKEIRRMKRKAIAQWFKDKWTTIVIAGGAFGVGAAVGVGSTL